MLNLDKLTQIDLNNLDVAQINKLLMENKKILRIVIIVAALAVAAGMFNDHRTQEAAMRKKISQEQAKLSVISARDASLAALNKYKASLPGPMDQFQLMTQISNDANIYHVTIATLNPPISQSGDMFDTLNFHFTAEADDFKDLMLFLRHIEKSKPPLSIDAWSGQQQGGKISFDIGLSAVQIHP